MKEIQEFKNIPLNKIISNNANEDLIDESDIANIITDIKEQGLSRPIIVSKDKDSYSLILGTRRFLASKRVNDKSIFCGIIDGKVERSEATAIALCYTSLEDMLSTQDKVLAIKFLKEYYNNDFSKISSATGLNIKAINFYLSFNDDIKKALKGIENTSKIAIEKKLSSLSPQELNNLINLLNKLN